nr:hypothetical protein [Actinomycetota bacterium]
NKNDVCDRCRRAEGEAELEARRGARAVRYWPVKYPKNPLKARITSLKRGLVAQMITRRGPFWDAIEEVRARWGLDPVPTQLPPDSDDLLYPPSVPTRRPPRPKEYIYPPDVPNPHMGEPGDLEQYEEWLRLRTEWDFDLGDVFRRGVPSRYVGEDSSSYRGWPAHEGRSLAWYRFTAACVLYQPPVEEAPVFAEYGGMPLLPERRDGDEPVPDVLTERELREGAVDLEVQIAMERKVSEKTWELRREIGHLDFRQARREVWKRHRSEFVNEHNRLSWEKYEREVESDPPRQYYIAVDPETTAEKDVLNALRKVREKEMPASKGGRISDDILLPVMIAVLLKQPGRTAPELADQLNLSAKRVREIEAEGLKRLDPDA